jgi:Mg-chelatase subunit ChlD
VLAPLTNDRHQVAAALGRLELRQGTRIDRALTTAVELLRAGDPSGARQRAILLLTDGVQIGPEGDAPVLEAARAARAARARIWAIGLGPGPDQALLRAISENAPEIIGGDANRLDDAMHDAVAALRCGR